MILDGQEFAPRGDCCIIGAIIAGVIDFVAGAGTAAEVAGAIGLTAADTALTGAIGTVGAGIVEGGIEGAGLGALTSAITGGKVGEGALVGGITGGIGGGIEGGFGGTTPFGGTTAAPGVSGGTGSAVAPAGAPGAPALGSSAGVGTVGGSAAPATAIGPSLGGGFSPGAASGADGIVGQLGSGSSSFSGFVDDAPGAAAAPSPGTIAAPQNTTGAGGAAGSGFANGGALATLNNAPPAVASGGGGVSGILESLGIGNSDADFISPVNAGKLALGVGTAAYDLTRPGIKSLPGYSQLSSEASTLGAQGQQLASYVNTGNLPPGAADAVSQATQQAIATVRSKYASMGQSGSTAEAEAVSGIQQQAAAEGFNIATQLLNSGINESQLASGIYQTILQANVSENNEVTSAISGLAGALGGGGATIKLAA